MVIQFSVNGIPKAQPRVKAFARNFGQGKWQARVYTPGTAEEWKGLIALAARSFVPEMPFAGPIRLDACFRMPRPKSHYRSNGELKPNAPAFHIGKPDRDNLEKAAMDAFTQIGLWRDDGQVCMGDVRKEYAAGAPGADFRIEAIEEANA